MEEKTTNGNKMIVSTENKPIQLVLPVDFPEVEKVEENSTSEKVTKDEKPYDEVKEEKHFINDATSARPPNYEDSWKQKQLLWSSRILLDSIMPQVSVFSGPVALFWLLVYLFFVFILFLQTYSTLADYFSHPVVVTVSIETNHKEIDFPAVTLCNNNIVKKSMISRIPYLQDLAFLDSYTMGSLIANVENAENVTCSETEEFKCQTKNLCIPSVWVCNGISECGDDSDESPKFDCSNHVGRNLTDTCASGLIQCPGETVCAQPCDNVDECTVDPGYDESVYVGCALQCGGVYEALPNPQPIESPNYPRGYNNSMNCEYTITAPLGLHVEINFGNFHIQQSRNCKSDYVKIRDGVSSTDNYFVINQRKKVCGEAQFDPIQSTSNGLVIYFSTDDSVIAKGWTLNYTAVSALLRKKRFTSFPSFYPGSDYPGYPEYPYTSPGGDYPSYYYPPAEIPSHYDYQTPPPPIHPFYFPSYPSRDYYDYYNYFRRFFPWENYQWGFDYSFGYVIGPAFYPEMDYYEDYGYTYFIPASSFKDVKPFHWYTLYRKSIMPDYSDMREFIRLDPDEIAGNGHQKEDFIIQCVFDEHLCSSAAFHTFQSQKHGNCFSFNNVGTGGAQSVLTSSKVGAQYGLKLALFLDKDEYIGIVGQKSGALLALHNSRESPNLDTKGVFLSAGTATALSLKYEEIEREKYPFSSCAETWPSFLELSEKYKKLEYNTDKCKKFCIQRKVALSCNCGDTFEWDFSANATIYNKTMFLCDIWDPSVKECLDNVYSNFTQDLYTCACPVACKQRDIVYASSSTEWPTEAYAPYMMSLLQRSTSRKVRDFVTSTLNTSNPTPSYLKQVIQTNFVQVEIQLETLNKFVITESPKYNLQTFFGVLGGNMGLWLGWSILSVLDIFQWFCSTVVVLVARVKTGPAKIDL